MGNPGHRPLPKAEPKPVTGAPECPPHLDGEAKKEWDRIVKDLDELGMISSLDRAGLTIYCTAWARLVSTAKTLAEERPIISAPSGRLEKNPNFSIFDAAVKHLQGAMAEFGLSPSARTRIHIDKASTDEDEARFFESS